MTFWPSEKTFTKFISDYQLFDIEVIINLIIHDIRRFDKSNYNAFLDYQNMTYNLLDLLKNVQI